MQILKTLHRHQLERLAATPSNWRVLNLNLATANLMAAENPRAGRFFQSRGLSRAAIVKHSVREHEEALFDNPPAIATKLLIPLDGATFAAGAVSVMIGERAYRETVLRWLGLKIADGPTLQKPATDALILAQLEAMPTFDPYLLNAAFGGGMYGIAEDYIQDSLVEDTALRAYLLAELTPLVMMAGGAQTRVPRFVDAMFGPRLDTAARDFLGKIGIAESGWQVTVDAWKAAMRCEAGLPKLRQRMTTRAHELMALPLYGIGGDQLSGARQAREDILAIATSLLADVLEAARAFGRERRAEVAAERLDSLGAFLSDLPASVSHFMALRAMAEHILSHWEMSQRSFGQGGVPVSAVHRLHQDITRIAEHVRQAFQRQTFLRAA